MLRSRRLEVVLSLEERKEQEALERMGEARKLAEQQREQVQNLNRYQQEYRDQIRNSQQGIVQVSRLQAWQAFIAQLDQVIRQQQTQLEQAEKVFEARKKEWQHAWERRRGMEKYIEIYIGYILNSLRLSAQLYRSFIVYNSYDMSHII